MTSQLPRLPMSKKIREVLAEQTGKPVGLGSIPRVPQSGDVDAPLVPADLPYVILTPLWATTFGGPGLTDPDIDVTWTYQVSSYGARGDQVEWLRDKITGVWLDRTAGQFTVPFTVAGMRVIDRGRGDDAGIDPGVDSSGVAVIPSDQRFTVTVTPS